MGTFSLDHRLINQFVLKKFTFIVKKNWGILIHLLSIFMFFSKLSLYKCFFFVYHVMIYLSNVSE